MDAKRELIATVAENPEPYTADVRQLFRSLCCLGASPPIRPDSLSQTSELTHDITPLPARHR